MVAAIQQAGTGPTGAEAASGGDWQAGRHLRKCQGQRQWRMELRGMTSCGSRATCLSQLPCTSCTSPF